MIPGETVGFEGAECCKKRLDLEVLESAAGYYLGYCCDQCGPYSRETGYYIYEEEAQADLDAYQKFHLTPSLARR